MASALDRYWNTQGYAELAKGRTGSKKSAAPLDHYDPHVLLKPVGWFPKQKASKDLYAGHGRRAEEPAAAAAVEQVLDEEAGEVREAPASRTAPRTAPRAVPSARAPRMPQEEVRSALRQSLRASGSLRHGTPPHSEREVQLEEVLVPMRRSSPRAEGEPRRSLLSALQRERRAAVIPRRIEVAVAEPPPPQQIALRPRAQRAAAAPPPQQALSRPAARRAQAPPLPIGAEPPRVPAGVQADAPPVAVQVAPAAAAEPEAAPQNNEALQRQLAHRARAAQLNVPAPTHFRLDGSPDYRHAAARVYRDAVAAAAVAQQHGTRGRPRAAPSPV